MNNASTFELILNHTELRNGVRYDTEHSRSASGVTANTAEEAIKIAFGLTNVKCEGVACGGNLVQVSTNGSGWIAYSYDELELLNSNKP